MLRQVIVLGSLVALTTAIMVAGYLQPVAGPALAITPTPVPPYPKLHVAHVTVGLEEEFAVDMTGQFMANDVYEISLEVEYPPGLLRVLDCVTPDIFECREETPGVVTVHGSSTVALSGDVDIGQIVFLASDYHCETFLPTTGRVLDQEGRDIVRRVNSGRVEIGEIDDPASGDVNCDGLDAIDALLVLQIAALLIGVGDVPYWPNAEVNGDGQYDSIDALLILQKSAGLL